MLAVLNERGDCQVLDFLEENKRGYHAAVRSMGALLRRQVPDYGPPLRMPLTRSLGDGIFEFRKQPKGHKLRVAFFYDENRIVVCTIAFAKAETSPPEVRKRSKEMRAEYLAAKAAGRLSIEETESTHGTTTR